LGEGKPVNSVGRGGKLHFCSSQGHKVEAGEDGGVESEYVVAIPAVVAGGLQINFDRQARDAASMADKGIVDHQCERARAMEQGEGECRVRLPTVVPEAG
jgi:hypothetical protein